MYVKDIRPKKAAQDANAITALFVLGGIGLILSLILVKEHYSEPEGESICDINSQISCTAVLTSAWASLLNIPLAFLGITYNLVHLAFTFQLSNRRNDKDAYVWTSIVFLWTAAGMVFVLYLLLGEFVVGAICPLCTLVHIDLLVMMYFAYGLYTRSNLAPIDVILRTLQTWIIIIGLIHLGLLIAFNLPKEEKMEPNDLEHFAKCLSENHVEMFGSPHCSHCQHQKKNFGAAFDYIIFNNCDENRDLCSDNAITGYPTWIMKDSKGAELGRLTGVQPFSNLAKLSGVCVADFKTDE